ALRHQVGTRRAVQRDRGAFKHLGDAARQHPAVGVDESLRRLGVVQLEIVLADDLVGGLADELRESGVDEIVVAVEVLDEDRVGRRLNDRVEDVGAGGNRHGTQPPKRSRMISARYRKSARSRGATTNALRSGATPGPRGTRYDTRSVIEVRPFSRVKPC